MVNIYTAVLQGHCIFDMLSLGHYISAATTDISTNNSGLAMDA